MINKKDGLFTCDYCGGQNGEFLSKSGNHVACQEIAMLKISKRANPLALFAGMYGIMMVFSAGIGFGFSYANKEPMSWYGVVIGLIGLGLVGWVSAKASTGD